MHNTLTIAADRSVSVHLYTTDTWAAGEGQGLPGPVAAFAKATGFAAGAGQCVTCPDQNGAMGHVLFGLGDGQDRLAVAGLSSQLPAEDYKLATLPEDWRFGDVAIGWMDGAYRFTRFKGSDYAPPRLLVPEDEDAPALSRIGVAVDLLRDLVNTPAGDMGPREIEAAIEILAGAHGAELTTLRGDDLIAENYPMVHAVGRAAADAPRIMELSWGQAGAPELALVGKGVAFDTGGLNIKTGDYMRLMKKDMGGAAHAIALAGLVMSASGTAGQIRSGEIKKFLIQPIDLVGFLFASRVAHKLAYYSVATIPFAIVFFLCRGYFPGWPPLGTLLAYIASLLMGFVLGFFLEVSLGLVGFWFLEVSSLLFVYMLFNFFLSGHMFPLDMLPAPFDTIVELLPLRYLAYFPAAVFLGKIQGTELVVGLFVEVAWIIFFVILSRMMLRRGLKRYSGFGG